MSLLSKAEAQMFPRPFWPMLVIYSELWMFQVNTSLATLPPLSLLLLLKGTDLKQRATQLQKGDLHLQHHRQGRRLSPKVGCQKKRLLPRYGWAQGIHPLSLLQQNPVAKTAFNNLWTYSSQCRDVSFRVRRVGNVIRQEQSQGISVKTKERMPDERELGYVHLSPT